MVFICIPIMQMKYVFGTVRIARDVATTAPHLATDMCSRIVQRRRNDNDYTHTRVARVTRSTVHQNIVS